MKSYLIVGLTCLALGALGGVALYKRLHPPVPCPAVQETKTATETRTIVRYRDSKGAPVEKETVVTEKREQMSKPAPVARPKNILGISGRLTPKGEIKVGPMYGRELFPNTFITGGIQVSPNGALKPEITAGIQLLF